MWWMPMSDRYAETLNVNIKLELILEQVLTENVME